MSRVPKLRNENTLRRLRMLGAALFAAAVLASSGSSVWGQSDSLQQKLESQFALTKVTADGGDIAAEGAVLVLKQRGVWMYSTASKLPPLNTYKNGKISKSMARDMAIAMLTKGNTGFVDLPKRIFPAGEKCWVIGLGIEKDGIVFRLYSAPYNGVRYYGELKFPFDKRSVPTPDQALTMIADVLAVQPADGSSAPEPVARTPMHAPEGRPLSLPATYVSAQTPADQIQLRADHSFSLQEGGQTFRGTFEANGNTLVLHIVENNTDTAVTVQGNKLTDSSGQVWVLQNAEQSGDYLPARDAGRPTLIPLPAISPTC